MDDQDIRKLDQLLLDVLGMSERQMLKIDQTPAWDSLSHLNLVVALEQEFHIQFAPEEIMNLYKDYDTILSCVSSKVSRARSERAKVSNARS